MGRRTMLGAVSGGGVSGGEGGKQFYNATFFESQKWDEFTLYQLQYFSRMLGAEIEKRELPVEIELASKDLKDIDAAIEQVDFEELQRKNDKQNRKEHAHSTGTNQHMVSNRPLTWACTPRLAHE